MFTKLLIGGVAASVLSVGGFAGYVSQYGCPLSGNCSGTSCPTAVAVEPCQESTGGCCGMTDPMPSTDTSEVLDIQPREVK